MKCVVEFNRVVKSRCVDRVDDNFLHGDQIATGSMESNSDAHIQSLGLARES